MHESLSVLLGRLAEEAGLEGGQIHLIALPSGERFTRDDGAWRYPASLIKLPLAVAVARAVEDGRLRWDSPVTVDARNGTLNDAPSPMLAGYRTDVAELVTFMLQRSDNVATNQLYDVLGRERATADVHALGFEQTFFRRKLSGADPLIDDPEATGRNSHPAAECAALLAALDAGRLPQSQRLREILAVSWWDVKLSGGLEPGDVFAHKTGDTDSVSHDAGILRLAGGARWAIAVYTELPSRKENDQRFGAFMRSLRPHLLNKRGP
ncbi:MAG TPA: serine hydrolase, partial [Candidatus Elarobacter sp.]